MKQMIFVVLLFSQKWCDNRHCCVSTCQSSEAIQMCLTCGSQGHVLKTILHSQKQFCHLVQSTRPTFVWIVKYVISQRHDSLLWWVPWQKKERRLLQCYTFDRVILTCFNCISSLDPIGPQWCICYAFRWWRWLIKSIWIFFALILMQLLQ